ncbi:MAG: hypothetical protein JO250_24740 [Armatimonadetes bacterium]|nr:hypothetical protein [Armatimonadota bacterium]
MPLLWLSLTAQADITVLPSRAAAPATVPATQAQCFQVQFLLRLPGLEALHFIGAVKSLRDIPAGDDAGIGQRIVELSEQAVTLRRDEARAFAALAPLLKAMGATPSLQSWAASEADRLGRPMQYSKDEQRQAKTEPQVAAILATLDEADALKTDTDAHLHDLALWLSLTRGPAALWAADVGELTAALHVALADHEEPRLAISVARRLRDTAPPGAPAAVRDALGLLVPKGGNLSGLVPVVTANVPAHSLAQAHDALLAAFAAKGLVAPEDVPKAPVDK